ncbi:MAG: hypothetical protein AAF599_03315, partial [Bacteroidota bacterium]
LGTLPSLRFTKLSTLKSRTANFANHTNSTALPIQASCLIHVPILQKSFSAKIKTFCRPLSIRLPALL